jgi:hypothetical protein
LDDGFFEVVNTEQKAYLLGWIAGDGTIQPENQIEIILNKKDQDILEQIRNVICSDLPIFLKDELFVGFRICSTQITKDVCKWLKIKPGKKNLDVSLPDLSDDLKWHFIRGLFDADGHVIKNHSYQKTSRCSIASTSKKMKRKLRSFCGLHCNVKKEHITWSGHESISFMKRLYKDSTIYMKRKHQMFLYWLEKYENQRDC